MGSLPNLRELEEGRRWSPPRQPHPPIRQTRSITNYHDNIHRYFTNEAEAVGWSLGQAEVHGVAGGGGLIVRRSSSSGGKGGGKERGGSVSSSGGASSVRRLIAVVRATSSRAAAPLYSRKILFKNFAALCLGHAMVTAALLPLVTLQGSISVWSPSSSSAPPGLGTGSGLPRTDYDAGSLLLASLFTVAALSTLGAVFSVDKLGTNWTLILGYGGSCLFLGTHLYPSAYTLIPAYLAMGAWLGPLVVARLSCLMTLASKLSYVMTAEEEDEVECARGGGGGLGRTEVIVHRLFRGLQIARDFGLIVGNLATSLLISYTTTTTTTATASTAAVAPQPLDSMFPVETTGDRVCGSAACPLSAPDPSNSTVPGIACKTSTMLVSVFLGFCVMGVAVTAAFMDRIRVMLKEPKVRHLSTSSFRLVRDAFADPRLQLAAPLSVFIGLEQGFIFADFTKWYVACSLGVANISLVFLSLGLLQSVAAFTLSLLLHHIQRHVVIVVGFIFQSCLLLVLLMWKPSREDAALFYVVPAAWGVCSAIWDTLSFSLLVSVYPESWQAPFAHSYFFRYLGLALAFGTHGSLCNWLKLYGLAVALVLAVTPYTWLELRHQAQRRLPTTL